MYSGLVMIDLLYIYINININKGRQVKLNALRFCYSFFYYFSPTSSACLLIRAFKQQEIPCMSFDEV